MKNACADQSYNNVFTIIKHCCCAYTMSSSVQLLCSNGKPADLLFKFDASDLHVPIDQMRFYYTDNQAAEPDVIASYIDGLLPAGNIYNVDVEPNKQRAQVLIPASTFQKNDQHKFKHYVLYSYVNPNGQTVISSTRDTDAAQWDMAQRCGSWNWFDSDHPYNRKQSLIIGLSSALGSLLVMLLLLATCCCVRKRRKEKARKEADALYYEANYGRDRPYDDHEFQLKTSSKPQQQAKKVSATTAYLQRYYSKLSTVKEKDRALQEEEDDGVAHLVDDETII